MKHKALLKLGRLLTKNSPTILTAVSVAGLVSTVIMAVKATPKAVQLIEEEKRRGSYDEMLKRDIIRVVWKPYIPAAIMGTITLGCIISANSLNLKRNAALAGLYSLSETALKEYKSKVVEYVGDDHERNIRHEISKDKIARDPLNDREVIITGRGETLCYDALSGRYFKSDIDHIRKVMIDLSVDLLNNDAVTLNEVYSALGLRSTKMGEWAEWHIDDGRVIEPEFSAQLTETGVPCMVLDYITDPRYIYRD